MYPLNINEKNAFLLHAKLKNFQNKVRAAKEVISSALSEYTNPALSFSAGKDSIVLLDLAQKCGFKGRLIFFKYGICNDIETPKENIELLKRYADKFGLEYHILDCLGEVDCWEMCGRFTLFPESEEEKRIFKLTNYDYAKQYAEFEKRENIDLLFLGMRKKESRKREIMLNQKGVIYETKTRRAVCCCPLANFSDEDIWAYIFSNELEYLHIYDYPYLDRRRNRNEITLLYNDWLINSGMIYHYELMYPEFFAWLKKKYPEAVW